MKRLLAAEPGAVGIHAKGKAVELALRTRFAVFPAEIAREIDARPLCPNGDRAVGQRLEPDGQVDSLAQPQPVQRTFEKPAPGDVEAAPAGQFETGAGSGNGRRFEHALRSHAEPALDPGGLARLLFPAQLLQSDLAGLQAGLDDILSRVVPVFRTDDIDLDGAAHDRGKVDAKALPRALIEGRSQRKDGLHGLAAGEPPLKVEHRRPAVERAAAGSADALLVDLQGDPRPFQVCHERGNGQVGVHDLPFRFDCNVVQRQRLEERQPHTEAKCGVAPCPRGCYPEIGGIAERLAVQHFQNLRQRPLEAQIRCQPGNRFRAIQPEKFDLAGGDIDIAILAIRQCHHKGFRIEDRIAVDIAEGRKRIPVTRRHAGKRDAAVKLGRSEIEGGLDADSGIDDDAGLFDPTPAQIRQHPLTGAGRSDSRRPQKPEIVHRDAGRPGFQMDVPAGLQAFAAAAGFDAAPVQFESERFDQHLPGPQFGLDEGIPGLECDGVRFGTGHAHAARADGQPHVQDHRPEVRIERPRHRAGDRRVQNGRKIQTGRQQRRQQGARDILQMRKGGKGPILPGAAARQPCGAAERLHFDCLDLQLREPVDGAGAYRKPVHRNAALRIFRIDDGAAGPVQLRTDCDDGKVRVQMDGHSAAQRCGHMIEQRQQRMGAGDSPGPQSMQPRRKRRSAGLAGKRHGKADIRFRSAEAQGCSALGDRIAGDATEGQVEPGNAPFRTHYVVDDRQRRSADAEIREVGSGGSGPGGQQAAQVELLRLFILVCACDGKETDGAVGPAPHGRADAEQFHTARHEPAAQQVLDSETEFEPLRLDQRFALQSLQLSLGNPEAQQPFPAGPDDIDGLQFHPISGLGTGQGCFDMGCEQSEIYRPLGQAPNRDGSQSQNGNREGSKYPEDMPKPDPQHSAPLDPP